MGFANENLPHPRELLLTPQQYEFPVVPYGYLDQLALQTALATRSLENFTVRLIISTTEIIPSIRWVAAIAQTGYLFEVLATQGITPPQRIEFISPVHQAATANGTSVEQAKRVGDQLFGLANDLLDFIFNDDDQIVVPQRILLRDTADDAIRLHELAQQTLLPHLDAIPDSVKNDLISKGRKHAQHDDTANQLTRSLTYLLGHLDSWGATDCLNVFPTTTDLLCIGPHSEAEFFGMMDQVGPFTSQFFPPSNRQVIRTIFTAIRHAHYLRPQIHREIAGKRRTVTEIDLADIGSSGNFPGTNTAKISGTPHLKTEHIVAIQTLERILEITRARRLNDPRNINQAIARDKGRIIKLFRKHGFFTATPNDTFGIYS